MLIKIISILKVINIKFSFFSAENNKIGLSIVDPNSMWDVSHIWTQQMNLLIMCPSQSIKSVWVWKVMSLTPAKNMCHACDNKIFIFCNRKLDYLLCIK